MEKREVKGTQGTVAPANAKLDARRRGIASAFQLPAPLAVIDGVTVLPLSKILRLALPPLFLSSLPRRAIGFSFPRGVEGKLLSVCLLVATATISSMLDKAFGLYPALLMVWLMGGTGLVVLYNSFGRGLAFVKQMCASCRLQPIIVEHELMHLNGVSSEEAVWNAAKAKYSYDGLRLGNDPSIHGFCPIAKRLKDSP